MIAWPVPDPVLPGTVDPVLAEAARTATAAFRSAREQFDREELAEKVQMGADGTSTTRLDILVDTAIAEVINRHRVNLLSEERCWHAVAGVPRSLPDNRPYRA